MYDWRIGTNLYMYMGSNAQSTRYQGRTWLCTRTSGNSNSSHNHRCLATTYWYFSWGFGKSWILCCHEMPMSFDSWKRALSYWFDNRQHFGTHAATQTCFPRGHPRWSTQLASCPSCMSSRASWSWRGWNDRFNPYACSVFWSKTIGWNFACCSHFWDTDHIQMVRPLHIYANCHSRTETQTRASYLQVSCSAGPHCSWQCPSYFH